MHKNIKKFGLLCTMAFILSACGLKPKTIVLENTQATKPQFARVILPLTEGQKTTQQSQLSTSNNGDVLIEQHKFKGGRVTGIFYSNRTVFKNKAKHETLQEIIDSTFVAGFMGDGRIMGDIQNHYNDDFGAGVYALVENTNKTKYCVVFSFTYLHPHIIKDTTLDGVLCRSAAEENAITMEFYAREFMTALKKR